MSDGRPGMSARSPTHPVAGRPADALDPGPGPWRGLRWLVVVGLALRLAFALAAQNVHHPDEVFQYLEQAHRLVFGYGVVPWEFRFGARSWLLALLISAPLGVSRLLGLGDPAFYVPLVKALFCLVSTSFIVLCYRIGRDLVSESAGRLAAVLACFWYELLYFASRPLADIVSAYFLLVGLSCVTDRAGKPRPMLFGSCLAVAIVLRFHYLPVAAFLFLLAAVTWKRPAVIRGAAALLGVGVLLAGYLDYLTWGSWFVSYYNYLFFNVLHGFSTTFGRMRPDWYLRKLAFTSAGVFPIVGLLSLVFVRRLWIPLVWILMTVGVHSLVPLKDYRFVFAALPMFLIMTAAVTHLVAERLMPARVAWARRATACLLGLIALAGIQGLLPREHEMYPHQPLYASQDELRAFAFLHRQPDLAGVLLKDVPWYRTGGYYHLHRDVPLYLPADEAAMSRDGSPGLYAYVSHIVCPASTAEIPGFARVAGFGQLDVRKQVTPRSSYAILPSYTRYPRQNDIDDAYRPSVKPRL